MMRFLPVLTKATLVVAAVAALVGCKRDPETRELEFMGDMYHSPALKAQESYELFPDGKASRLPVEGTLPRGFQANKIAWNEIPLSEAMPNPLPRTADVLAAGRRYYNTNCITCHNWNGNGVTPVTQPGRMPMPPVIYSDKVVAWPDGHLFHVITHGQGNMPGYAHKLTPEQRWAVVHYVRALQTAARPTEQQIAAFDRAGKPGAANDNPLVPPAQPQAFPAR